MRHPNEIQLVERHPDGAVRATKDYDDILDSVWALSKGSVFTVEQFEGTVNAQATQQLDDLGVPRAKVYTARDRRRMEELAEEYEAGCGP